MKICHINPFFYPYFGGIERRIYHVCKRLADDHEVWVLTSRLEGTQKTEELDGIKIARVETSLLPIYNPPVVLSSGIYQKARDLAPDIVDFHYRWAPDYTRAVKKISRHFPVVFTFHNDFGEGTGWMGAVSQVNDMWFKRFLHKYASRIVCISDYVQKRLRTKNIAKRKLATIRNGVELDHSVRPAHDGAYILYVGRLVKTKGLHHLIKAHAAAGSPVPLKICGEGPQRGHLQALSRRLDSDVEFLGWVSEGRKRELLRACTAFVLPSVFESFGVVLLEAMRAHCPIIATDVGGIPEVVGDAALLVEPRSPQQLATAITQLCGDPERRETLSRRAARRVQRFTWDKICDETLDLYREITAGR